VIKRVTEVIAVRFGCTASPIRPTLRAFSVEESVCVGWQLRADGGSMAEPPVEESGHLPNEKL
jgi:hypothetical protein